MSRKGQMSRGANSGPAVMMMPPHIRATFMPNPPLEQIPPLPKRRKTQISGVQRFLKEFETGKPKEKVPTLTPKKLRKEQKERREREHLKKLEPEIEKFRKDQQDLGGEYQGMNCYNTLFIGRLAFEVTERKLLREMETFGPVKDLKLVRDKAGKSKGYGFVEYENEDDMKRAYRGADGMKIEGRYIVVDVERGHTVPSWLPRRLGGGLGGTRLGGNDKNVNRPGRFDPTVVDSLSFNSALPGGDGRGHGGGGNAAEEFDGRRVQYGNYQSGTYGRGGREWGNERSSYNDGGRRRRRSRSRSPEYRYAPRPRY
ncbi:unnamed protein product [Cylindrotheca closterium]|uniref:RRM domain-containing protein n=1 Tax=Cylindrotheca closterium TaxID=2856 RepID=A0AAD2G7T5_9STRA|nr:unnamed protein product [Cylindrotheca closterium]